LKKKKRRNKTKMVLKNTEQNEKQGKMVKKIPFFAGKIPISGQNSDFE
jgi:hypothetical protein